MHTAGSNDGRALAESGSGPATFSVIVEWENAKLSDAARSRRMLHTLATQVRDLDRTRWTARDLVVLYDSVAISGSELESFIRSAMAPMPPFASVKVIQANGMRYYELKNFGATKTEGDAIVLLDSDVIPESGWLGQLLEALRTKGVDVVGGNTYVSLDTLYSKAFALFWFFPMRSAASALRPSESFFANNVAFRKSVFEAHPFPKHSKFRGQCTDLARILTAEGFGIYLHEGARVDHPPPNGLRHFVSRALCAGYDQVRVVENPSLEEAWKRLRHRLGQASRRIGRYGAELGLGITGRAAARGIAGGYYSLMFAGECITLVAPGIVPRYFAI
jgi:hypothetical protein